MIEFRIALTGFFEPGLLPPPLPLPSPYIGVTRSGDRLYGTRRRGLPH